MRKRNIFCILSIYMLLIPCTGLMSQDLDSTIFFANQILSRPSDQSVTIIVVPRKAVQLFYEYGTSSQVYAAQTALCTATPNVPVKLQLTGLQPNTRYYYRIRYKSPGNDQVSAGQEYSFMTQRSKGSTFKFAITADSHLYDKKGIPSMMRVTMQNIRNMNPDLLIDLGDTFGDDHQPTTITQQDLMQLHLNFMPFIGMAAGSAHFFFCLGNHEGENGYFLLQNPPDNMAVYGTLARKYYYANPVPDNFYTGNSNTENFGIGYPENYYAWQWGDALFVVIDVYRGYSASEKPEGWDWTLGTEQYNWFKTTLEQSTAKYKFVFAHHVSGQGRGGIVLAKNYEWGGYEKDGKTWGFAGKRPGWDMPIHQLMVKNGVSIFFQGHDHLFAQELLDGIVYQEVPMPSDSTYMIGMLANADAYTANQLNGAGHLMVTVSPEQAKVEYIRGYLAHDTSATQVNASVAFSYTVAPRTMGIAKERPASSAIRLEQNYPNPFNPSTTIQYEIARPGNVTLKVFDMLGREVTTLVNAYQQPGVYSVQLTAQELTGGTVHTPMASSVFVYQVRTGDAMLYRKAVFLK